MSKIWHRLGVITYWATWPGLWLMLRWSHRTRLMIICDGEFLVLRGWLGSGTWGLPGGGLHRNEKPLDGLLREVQEEIGVTLLPEQVTYAYDDYAKERGLKFHYHAFICELKEKPVVRPQPREIADIKWQSIITPTLDLNHDAAAVRQWWLNRG